MLNLALHERLTRLGEAISTVAPCVSLGFARSESDRRVSVLYSHASGLGEFVVAAEGGTITPEHLAIGLGARAALARQRRDTDREAERQVVKTVSPPAVPVPPTNDLKVLERDLIEQTLQRVHFNKSKAAKDLGLSRAQLYARMKKYGLG